MASLLTGGIFSAFPARAKPQSYGASTVADDPSGVEVPTGSTVIVTGSDCQLLQKYVPSADVDYQPGVTADGEKVAPADLSPTTGFGAAKDLDFSFTVRLKDVLPPTAGNATEVLGEAPVGRVTVQGGVVSFNGVPLDESQLRAVSDGCAAARRQHEKRKKHK